MRHSGRLNLFFESASSPSQQFRVFGWNFQELREHRKSTSGATSATKGQAMGSLKVIQSATELPSSVLAMSTHGSLRSATSVVRVESHGATLLPGSAGRWALVRCRKQKLEQQLFSSPALELGVVTSVCLPNAVTLQRYIAGVTFTNALDDTSKGCSSCSAAAAAAAFFVLRCSRIPCGALRVLL